MVGTDELNHSQAAGSVHVSEEAANSSTVEEDTDEEGENLSDKQAATSGKKRNAKVSV